MPNVFLAYSYRPERLSAWFGHYKQLHEPTESLDAAEREMIAVAVSMANGCLYCLVAHGAALRAALGAPILADRITLDYRRAFRAILSAFHLSHPFGDRAFRSAASTASEVALRGFSVPGQER